MLEYQQFKEAAEHLRERDVLGRDIFIRSGDQKEWMELAEGLEFEPVGLFQLVEAFRLVLEETDEEFHRLHDCAVDAVRRALPSARVGGPDSAGGGEFLREFLEHCLRGSEACNGDSLG